MEIMKPDREDGSTLDSPADGSEASGGESCAGEAGAQGAAADQIREQLAAAERAAAENQDLYLRERAELENFKKRSARERSEAVRYAVEPFARDVIGLVDDLERALGHARAAGDGSPVLAGVELVLKNAVDVLHRHGVERIEAVGHAFDPSLHEAVTQVWDRALPANHVAEQFAPGYRLHQRLLRAAQVAVTAGPETKDEVS